MIGTKKKLVGKWGGPRGRGKRQIFLNPTKITYRKGGCGKHGHWTKYETSVLKDKTPVGEKGLL